MEGNVAGFHPDDVLNTFFDDWNFRVAQWNNCKEDRDIGQRDDKEQKVGPDPHPLDHTASKSVGLFFQFIFVIVEQEVSFEILTRQRSWCLDVVMGSSRW